MSPSLRATWLSSIAVDDDDLCPLVSHHRRAVTSSCFPTVGCQCDPLLKADTPTPLSGVRLLKSWCPMSLRASHVSRVVDDILVHEQAKGIKKRVMEQRVGHAVTAGKLEAEKLKEAGDDKVGPHFVYRQTPRPALSPSDAARVTHAFRRMKT